MGGSHWANVVSEVDSISGTKQGRVKGLRRNEADRQMTKLPVLAKTQSTFLIYFEEG